MSVRKIASWLVLAMVILFLINSPESAAQIVLSGASALDRRRFLARLLRGLAL